MIIPEITSLIEKAKQATQDKWNYEAERYSARCVIGQKPTSDKWIATFQPENNGEHNALFVCAANPSAILSLAQSYLEAVEVLKQLLIASERHSELTNTIWPSMDNQMKSAQNFLKKVGCDD